MSVVGRLLRFALVGITCFVAQWCALHFLRQFVGVWTADAIAFVLSAQLNFMLSKAITWHDHDEGLRLSVVWGRYNVVALFAAILNAVVVSPVDVYAGEFWALIAAGAVSGGVSFVLNHYYVFRSEQPAPPAPMLEKLEEDITDHVRDGIAIFMPAYNEAENLPAVVGKTVAWLQNRRVPYTVIVVNDGSADNTLQVMSKLSQQDPNVRCVTHRVNQGYGAALRTGFEACLQTGHGWIGFLDSDDQFDPTEFNWLIARAVNEGAEACLGVRVKRADGLKRRLTGRAWHIISGKLLGQSHAAQTYDGFKASDVDCGFKMFRRHVVAAISPDLSGEYATISPEILRRLAAGGFRVTEQGVNHYARTKGSQTGLNLKVVVGSFQNLIRMRRQLRTSPVSASIPEFESVA